VSQTVIAESPRPKYGRWLIAFVLLNLLVFGRLAWFWYLSEPKRQLTIGRETTFVDGPLSADGYVDYIAAVNQRLAEGVTPENNAVPLLIAAYGPQVISDAASPKYFELLGVPRSSAGGQYLIDESAFINRSMAGQDTSTAIQTLNDHRETASKRPWTRAEFPDVAAMLDANAPPLALLTAASQRPRYYSPLISSQDTPSMFGVLLPLEQQQREAARQLTARAMLRLGEGDTSGAWDDLLACHRLARQTGQCPFLIGALVGMAIEAMAVEADQALIASPQLTAELARKCVADLEGLPPLPSIADDMDNTERLGLLDAVVLMARDPSAMDEIAPGVSVPALSGAIDWNIVLQLVNDEFDKVVAAMRSTELTTRAAEVDKLLQSPRDHTRTIMALGVRSFLGNRTSASRDMGWSILQTYLPAASMAIVAETRAIARARLARTGFALAVWEREHGAYPESLAELVPGVLPALPIDPWSGSMLHYRRTADGFVLYSLDDNMLDDGGMPMDRERGRDHADLVLRVGTE